MYVCAAEHSSAIAVDHVRNCDPRAGNIKVTLQCKY